jgi:hypothetical protein
VIGADDNADPHYPAGATRHLPSFAHQHIFRLFWLYA